MSVIRDAARYFLAASFSLLVACGGGGETNGGSDPQLVIEKKEQTGLSFAQVEVEYYLHSEVQENELSGGSGSGVISYSSSDAAVVSVDASTGMIVLLSVGEASITASKAGDVDYKPASATFLVKVLEADPQAPLAFEFDERLVDYSLQSTVVNSLRGGSGEGALTFSSSDEAVATVNVSSGEVTLLNAGAATISVVKSAAGRFAEASAEYSLTVVGPPTALLASIGITDSEFTLDGVFSSTDFYRFANKDCDVSNYATCSQSTMITVTTESQLPIEDSYIAVGLPAFVLLERAKLQSSPVKVEAQRPPFDRRLGQATVSFKGKLFVIAGQDNSAGESGNDTYWYNDVWSSEDGIHWVQEVVETDFSARAFHKVLVYQNTLYLIGGKEGVGTDGAARIKRDVWKSNDGVVWERVVDNAPFSGQGQSIVFDERMWVIGDAYFTGDSKIYSSSDGLNWDLELEESPFGSRQDMAVYKWAGKLFVSGGMGVGGSDDLFNDVWSSPDGKTWTKETDDGGYEARVAMSVSALGGKLLLIGGHSFSDGHNSVYSSSDGVSWALSVSNVLKKMNQTHSLTSHQGKLWLYSGLTSDYLWFSEDGENWKTPVSFPLDWQSSAE